jgi:leucyl-tRNA synthetase
VNVNWCPALGTVLANEEVINGLSERGGHPVIRQPVRQWVLKITDYADKLEEDLIQVDWPEGTLSAQRQWIGRSEGASIQFPIATNNASNQKIEVFTTRPDTLLGVTYLVLAPEHPLVPSLTTLSQQSLVEQYIQEIAGKSDLERTAVGKEKGKSGVFIGSYVKHPITQEEIPIWIADYVLAGYGTGAVMAVPAHDERDYHFAMKFQLPIKTVISPPTNTEEMTLPYCDEGIVQNSGELFNGLTSTEAKIKIIETLQVNQLGQSQISYKLRDWIFSRQRYWGEPIPIYFPVDMHPKESGDGTIIPESDLSPITGDPHIIRYDQPIAISETSLPLELPEMTDFHPGDDPQGCLARAKHWRYFQQADPSTGKVRWYARETNTMPQVSKTEGCA